MPNVTSRRWFLSVLVPVLLLSGCSAFSGADERAPEESPAAAAPDVLAGLEAALDRRAAAVRKGDARGFLAGLVHGDQALRADQATYFANLRQLPIGTFDYDVDPADLVREGDDYAAVVELRLQLTGFDSRPVVTARLFHFAAGRAAGRYVVTSVSDPAWDEEHGVSLQPWDLGPVLVRSLPGVLGVFDAGSVHAADPLLAAVRQGIDDVAAVVPLEWARTVVVYALSDTRFLSSIPDLPGGDPQTLDGVAFPVVAVPGRAALASTRLALHPRMLDRSGAARDRLVRHELTHVAIGKRDDEAPIWLSEGLAEYVSVRALPVEQRGISQSAVDAAVAGFGDLPSDEAFNDADSRVHYGEAWWACEYVATSYGEPTLWSLLDRFDGSHGDAAQVLKSWIGLTTRQLARRAGRLLLLGFEPSAVRTPVTHF